MSKNFELLRRITDEEELYRTTGRPQYSRHAESVEHRPEFREDQWASSETRIQRVGAQIPPDGPPLLPIEHPAAPVRTAREGFVKGAYPSLEWDPHCNDWRTHSEAASHEEDLKLAYRVFPGPDERSPHVVLFSALNSDTECAALCVRVGSILADRADGPVCVADANFRSPSLHERFGLDNSEGLADAAGDPRPIRAFARQVASSNLWLLPSGRLSDDISRPAIADRLRARMTELREAFTYVIVQAAALQLESAGVWLSRWTDGVVLVLEANSTRREVARRVKEHLGFVNVAVLGVVLNSRTLSSPFALYAKR
ncbi:MAG: hypothetical protein DMF89_10320 [Acidobacteria bacterium]|nr:MAG: hypothetical protein DMF89_10320 [Acidobacteriota bacterium]